MSSNDLDPLTAEIIFEFQKRSPAAQEVFMNLIRKASDIPETPEGKVAFEKLCAEAKSKMAALS